MLFILSGGVGVEYFEERIQKARMDKEEREKLLIEYQSFIRKNVSKFLGYGLEYDDLFSIAMLVFVNCIYQYEESRGNFLSFVSICIRNRLLDELRKQKAYESHLLPIEREEGEQIQVVSKAVSIYNQHQEQEALKEEIACLTINLEKYGISWSELPEICPKQKRSRLQCNYLARLLVGNEKWKQDFLAEQKLPRAKLAKTANISEKTIEKHRKYIVTLVLILLGDYPGIRSFLP